MPVVYERERWLSVIAALLGSQKMPESIPKSLQDGPKEPEPEKIDGWFRAALKRQPWCLRSKTALPAAPKPKVFSERTVHKLIRAHMDQTTLGRLR